MPNIGLGVTDLDKLEDETNLKLGCAKPADLSTKKKRALSHRGTEPETLMEPVTGIEPATH